MTSLYSIGATPLLLPNEEVATGPSFRATTHGKYSMQDPYDWLCVVADYLNPHRLPFFHATVSHVQALTRHLPAPPLLLTRQWLQMVWREEGEPPLLYLIRCLAFHYALTMLAPTVVLDSEDQWGRCGTPDESVTGPIIGRLHWPDWPSTVYHTSCRISSSLSSTSSGFPTPPLPPPSCARPLLREEATTVGVRWGTFRVVGQYLPSHASSFLTGACRMGGEGYGGDGGETLLTEYVQTGWETYCCTACVFWNETKKNKKKWCISHASAECGGGASLSSFRCPLPAHLGGDQCEHCGAFLSRYPTWSVRARVVLVEERPLPSTRTTDGWGKPLGVWKEGGGAYQRSGMRESPSCAAVVMGEANIAAFRLGGLVRCIYFERLPSSSSSFSTAMAQGEEGKMDVGVSRMLAIHSVCPVVEEYAIRGAGGRDERAAMTVRPRYDGRASSSSSSVASTMSLPPSCVRATLASLTLDTACSIFEPDVLGQPSAKQALLLCALYTMYMRHLSHQWPSFPPVGGTPVLPPTPLHAVLIGPGKSGKSSLLQAMSRMWAGAAAPKQGHHTNNSGGGRGGTTTYWSTTTVARGGLEALWSHRSGNVWCGGAAVVSPAIQLEEGVVLSSSKPSATLLHLRGWLEYGEMGERLPFSSTRSSPCRVPSPAAGGHPEARRGGGEGKQGWRRGRVVGSMPLPSTVPSSFFSFSCPRTQLTVGMAEDLLPTAVSGVASLAGVLPSFRLCIPLVGGLSLSHSVAISERVRSEASVRRVESTSSLSYSPSPFRSSRSGGASLHLSPFPTPPPPPLPLSTASPCHLRSETPDGDSPAISLPWHPSFLGPPRSIPISASPSIPQTPDPHPFLHPPWGPPEVNGATRATHGASKALVEHWLQCIRGEYPPPFGALQCGPPIAGTADPLVGCFPPPYAAIDTALKVARARCFFYDRLREHFWWVQQATPTMREAAGATTRNGKGAIGLLLPAPACLRGDTVPHSSDLASSSRKKKKHHHHSATQECIPASECVCFQRHLATLHALAVSRLLLPDAVVFPPVQDESVGERPSCDGSPSLVFTMKMAEEVWQVYGISLRTAARYTMGHLHGPDEGDWRGKDGSLLSSTAAGRGGDGSAFRTSLPPSTLLSSSWMGTKRGRGGRPAKKVLCMQFVQGLQQLQRKCATHPREDGDGGTSNPHDAMVCRAELVKQLYAQMGGMDVFQDTLDGFVSQLREMGMMIKRPGGWIVRAV